MTKTILPFFRVCHLLVALIVTTVAAPVLAQSPFSAAARVNDDVVTYYEISQRQLFLRLLDAADTDAEAVLEALIEERLQAQAGERMGVVADADQIEAGVEEFAARANMGPEQFIRAITADGVAPETFRDFVSAGITWRNVLTSRFGPQARVSDDEVERALASGITTGGTRVRIAELIVPILPQNEANFESELARLARDVDGSFDRFAEAARRFSAAPSREDGGLTDWRPITALPLNIQNMLRSMSPGDVSEPINLGNAFGIFQLRGMGEAPVVRATVGTVDYVTIPIPGGRTTEALEEAARLRNALDRCDDLYGVLSGGFERRTAAVRDIPQDIAVALSRLDPDEMSTDVTRQQGSVLLVTMLCARNYDVPDSARDEVREALFRQRLEALSSNYLEELRAESIITYAGG